MNIKQLFDDDSAVSPVIGVILMVAITVILAAVIATFVLGLGDQLSSTAPQASFSADYDGEYLTFTHDNGERIEAGNLYVRGSGDDGSWNELNSTAYDTDSMISAGNSITVSASDGDTVRVIYEPADGGSSATLKTWEGPDA